MKYTSGLLAIAAAIPSALAVEFTNSNFDVVAGKPFTLTWSDANGDVTITLKDGASTDLQDVEVLASGQTGTSFTWTPDSSLPSDTYAFEIDDSAGVPNYSSQFKFAGGADASETTTVASASSHLTTHSTTLSPTSSSATLASTTKPASSTGSASSSGHTAVESTWSGNSTSTATSSSSSKKTSASKTSGAASTSSTPSSTTTPVNTNDGKMLGSPLALILGTVISLVVFN